MNKFYRKVVDFHNTSKAKTIYLTALGIMLFSGYVYIKKEGLAKRDELLQKQHIEKLVEDEHKFSQPSINSFMFPYQPNEINYDLLKP